MHARAGIRVAVWGLAVLAVTSTVWAEPPAAATPDTLPGVDRLGGDTTGYVYRMGWDELKASLKGTTALDVIEDPEVRAFRDAVGAIGGNELEGAGVRFVIKALHKELIMVTVTPQMQRGAAAGAPDRRDPSAKSNDADANEKDAATSEEELQEDGDEPGVSIEHLRYAFIRPGASEADAFRTQFDGFTTWAKAWFGDVETQDVGGVSFQRVGTTDDGMYGGFRDGELLWAVGQEAAKLAVQTKAADPLARSALFRASVEPLLAGQKGKPVALYYYDLRPSWANRAVGPQATAWDVLSWRSLDAVSGATFVEGKGYRNRHYWKIGDKRRGLFQHSQAIRVAPAWLKRVPADAGSFTYGVMDATSFVASVLTLGAACTGEDVDTQTMVIGATMQIQPLLQNLGPRYLVYRVPGRYGAFPLTDVLPVNDVVAIVESKDSHAFVKTLDEMLANVGDLTPISYRPHTIAGHDARVLNLVYWTVYVVPMEKQLIVAANPQLLKDALDQLARPGPSIVDTPAFQAVQKYVQKDACFMMYLAPGGFTRGFYDRFIPSLQQLMGMVGAFSRMMDGEDDEDRPFGEGFDAVAFPRGRAITRHVTEATILTARDDGQGVLFDGYAPVVCTPYYWAYLHALTRLQPAGGPGVFHMMYYLSTSPKPVPPGEPPKPGVR